MKLDLTNQLAVVTGASRGIGFFIASALHNAGMKVVISGRNPDTINQAAKRIGDRCFAHPCDHGNPEAIEAFAATVHERYGSPHSLINNAGIMKSEPIQHLDPKLWNEVIATNLTGVFLTTKAFLPGMMERNRGDIIMISSMSGKKGDPGGSLYSASKFGVQGFAQGLMHDVRRHNIRVMVLNPSKVDTQPDSGSPHGPEHFLHASDIADTVVHLLQLPGRTLIRDMDIWGTNPFPA